MKCQKLFSGEIKKKIRVISLMSVELSHRVVKAGLFCFAQYSFMFMLLYTPMGVDNLNVCHCIGSNFTKGHGLVQFYFPRTAQRNYNQKLLSFSPCAIRRPS